MLSIEYISINQQNQNFIYFNYLFITSYLFIYFYIKSRIVQFQITSQIKIKLHFKLIYKQLISFLELGRNKVSCMLSWILAGCFIWIKTIFLNEDGWCRVNDLEQLLKATISNTEKLVSIEVPL